MNPRDAHHPELEKPRLDVGFVPLTDCAPLVVALEKGFFADEGLDVSLWRERSWASIRDKTAFGLFDAAQMLYPMPLAMSFGVGGPVEPTVTAMCLDLNGNAITVSERLHREMQRHNTDAMRRRPTTADALRAVLARRRERAEPPPTFGVVFPTSTHHYELRYWLAAAGIDPDRDLEIVVLPPPEMPEALRDGRIDGFCVGEPWNSVAVREGVGRVLITKYELWNNSPEKVLGVTRRWAEAHPATHRALVRALLKACAWCDEPDHRGEVAQTLSAPGYVDTPVDVLRMSMRGTFQYARDEAPVLLEDFNVFHRYAANYPWRSHAMWFLQQMRRWGQIENAPPLRDAADAVRMPEVYRDAAHALGIASPTSPDKPEGVHGEAWELGEPGACIGMGPDLFFDGAAFDPDLASDTPAVSEPPAEPH